MIIKKPSSEAADALDAAPPKSLLQWLLSNWQPILAALYALVFFAVVASVPAEGAPNDVAASSVNRPNGGWIGGSRSLADQADADGGDWITDLVVIEFADEL
jgi:hypothetical protein